MSELPAGVNLRQHGAAGELPQGHHPSTYPDPGDHRRRGMQLYSRYVKAGDLVFDVGANVGERTGWFLELGCEVVAVEPQYDQLSHCSPQAHRIHGAVGATAGTARFHRCEHSPYLSTLSDEYVAQVLAQPGIGGNIFTISETEVVTMDELIERFGVPAFAKVDVEGGELGVLEGLSQPLAALSFEVHQFAPEKAWACIDRLELLAQYRYEYSPLESFVLEPWPPPDPWPIFGDVYATRA